VSGPCAWAARNIFTYLGRTFHRLEARRGGTNAAMAGTQKMLVMVSERAAERTLYDQVVSSGKSCHVGADLGDEHLGRAASHTGDRIQHAQGLCNRATDCLDLRIKAGNGGFCRHFHVRPLACSHGRSPRPHARRPQPGPSEAAGSCRSPHPHHSPADRHRVQALRHSAECGGPSSSLTSTSSSASRLGPSIITARVSPSR
jgi:hypothetical protein